MKFEFSPFVAVEVSDYERACEYYEKVLGMQMIKKHPVESHLKSGDMNFFISGTQKKEIFFEFRVEDAEAAKKLLEQNGCKVTNVYSEKSFLVSDPFGLNYHIFQE
jgi:catechol 2,3-dioxygenase-like lactoylglutathione lyase family enzyme